MADRLVEDYWGTYWWGGTLPVEQAHVERGYRYLNTYAAMCTDLDCCWHVLIRRRADGWWWEHDNLATEQLVEGGPFDEWQLAARAAVEAGEARPVT